MEELNLDSSGGTSGATPGSSKVTKHGKKEAKNEKPKRASPRDIEKRLPGFYDDLIRMIESYEAVWNIDNRDEYLNFAKKKEAWDIIWQFFVIEYSRITGKYELLQELGITGIQVLKDLWNAKVTQHRSNLKQQKHAIDHSGQGSKEFLRAQSHHDPRYAHNSF